ncbi:hypothetical protein [Pseudomonas sp. 34 E 7]|nr:hypothetical protein [Pseudomonas sp. 34 E 7]
MVVEQCAGVDRERLPAAERGEVVERARVDQQVGGRGQAAAVVQGAAEGGAGHATAGDAGGVTQVGLGGGQVQFAQAADAPAAVQRAAQAQVKVAVAGDKAVGGPVATAADKASGAEQLTGRGLFEAVDVDGQLPGLDHAAVGPGVLGDGQVATGDQAAAYIVEIARRDAEGAGAHMQHIAAEVLQAVGVQGQVGVGRFQHAVAVVEQPANGELGGAAVTQCAQATGLVVQAGGTDLEGGFAFDDAQAVIQRAAEVQVDLLAGDLAIVVTAVIEVMPDHAHQAFGIEPAVAVVEVAGGDQRVAALRGDAPAVVVYAAGLQVEALPLHHAALAVVIEVVTVAQHADHLGLQCGLEAGEGAATVVEAGRVDMQVTGLGNQFAALVIQRVGHVGGHAALALHGALAIVQAVGAEQQVGVLAVDQAVVAVLHQAAGGQAQAFVGGQGATVAVVQAAGQQGQQALAGNLATLVVDLRRAADQQWAAAGQFAVGVGQGGEQVEGGGGAATDTAGAVVQVLRVQAQGRAAVDHAALGVVQQAADGKRLPGRAGKYAFVAVVQFARVDGQGFLADQRAACAVEQAGGQRGIEVAVSARQGAAVTVIQVRTADRQTLPAGHQAILVDQVFGIEHQQVIADQLAVAVIQRAAFEVQGLRAGEFAALVAEVTQVVDAQVAGGGDQATGVVQVAGGGAEVQGNRAAQQRAVLVGQARGIDAQKVGCVDQALGLVGQWAAHVEQGVATAGEGAAAVVQAGGACVNRSRSNHTLDVSQGLADAQSQGGVAQQFAAAVIEVVGGECEGLAAGNLAALVMHILEVVEHQQRRVDQPALVVELTTVEVQGQGLRAGDLPALLVVQVGGADVRGLARAQGALLAVVDACAGQGQGAVSHQAPALVVHRVTGADAQRAGAGERATTVDQGARGHGEQPFAADQALVAVEQLIDVQVQPSAGHYQAAIAVIQLRAVHRHARTAGELAVAVVDVGDVDLHAAGAGDQAFLAVVQAITGEVKNALAGDAPVLVVERAGVEAQRLARRDQARDVVQGGHRQVGSVQAGDFAAGILHRAQRGSQRPVTGDQSALAVLQRAGVDSQRGVAEDSSVVAVIDGRRRHAGALPGAEGAALVVQGLGIDAQAAAGDHAGAVVVDGLAAQADVACGVAGVIGVDAGFDDVCVGQRAAAGQRNAVTCGQAFATVEIALGLHLQSGTGINWSLGVKAGGFDIDCAAGSGLRHAQAPIGIKLDIPTTGRQGAIKLHAHTGLGAHQFDRAGVHAAQGRRVDRQLGFGAAVIGAGGGFQALCIDVVAPGDDVEFAGVDLRVDPGRAGDDVEAVDVAGVQAFAIDGHGAAIDLVAFQLAGRVDDRLTRGQGHVGRIDKAATAARHAVRVGHDDLGRLPRHFGITAQLTGAAAVDFVKNDAGRAALEVGVADNDPAQLGVLQRAVGVVENHAVGADVVLLELVMGQACAVRCGDVHHRHAIARRAHRGTWRTDHDALGLGQQRLPEQRVGEDQRQPAFGQAEERVSRLQGGGRLAGQEGKLSNVHFQFLAAAQR